MTYLFAAFSAVWILLFLYLVSLSRRYASLRREVETLERRMASASADPHKASGGQT